jgi:hypothetical protein
MIRTKPLAMLALLAMAASAHAADWRTLADTNVGKLSYDAASVKPQGAQTSVQYRVDFKAPQKNPGTGKVYRSTVTEGLLGCKEKFIGMAQLVAYSEPEGKGDTVDRVTFAKPALNAIVVGSSDEMLWKALCPAPAPAAAPPAAPAAPAAKAKK